MQRAAVLVGVNKTGNLPKLHAATAGVRAMEAWARKQGMKPELVKVLTDDSGVLEVQKIKKAIKEIVELTTIDQLIVYFSGHGVNLRYGEYWLLSDAPSDPQAAVNVEGSIALARHAGIPHVVFVSDACRTAAEGIQAQHVTGSEVFPNTGAGGLEQAVDVFFACTLGMPAHEIKNPTWAASMFKGVYTDALVEALEGHCAQVLQENEEAGETVALVRPVLLKEYLQEEVVDRLAGAGVQLGISQRPDARITSGAQAWLSRLPSGVRQVNRGGRPTIHTEYAGTEDGPPPETFTTISQLLLRNTLSDEKKTVIGGPDARILHPETTKSLLDSVYRTEKPFGPSNLETNCGLKIRGARVVEAYSRRSTTELLGGAGDVVRIDQIAGPAANVLLSFDNGVGVLLPAIPGFLTGLTFEKRELVDVAYEPSDRSSRWPEYQSKFWELRTLRAVIVASARLGVFRLERDDAFQLARRMQVAKGIDPIMALYAGYAYHDMQDRDRIVEMEDYLLDDLGIRLFDISLLARSLGGQKPSLRADVFPFIPLLSQGWALLAAHGVVLPPSLSRLEQHLVPSLWSVFDQDGIARVRLAMSRQEVT